jgi:hypothetical protein
VADYNRVAIPVKDLIEKLQKLPNDSVIALFTRDSDYDDYWGYYEISVEHIVGNEYQIQG